jgi:hypothetical protein
MGGSSSKVASAVLNNTLNLTDIENTTKNVQESATSTLVKSASSCSSAVSQSNVCDMSGTKITGGFKFGGKQSNKASVNFSCVQASKAASEMTDSMASSIANELGVLNGTEAATKLNAAAEASNKTGAGAWGGGDAKSSVSTKVSNEVTNATKSHIENIFKKNLSNNFSSETVNECIGKTSQSNEQLLKNMNIEGGASVECNQSNSLESVQECKQLSEAINSTISETAQELGFKVSSKTDTVTSSEVAASAKSENVSTGPLQDLGGLIGGIASLASLGIAGPFIVYSCCICCCIILSIVSSMFVMKSGGGSANTSAPSGLNMPHGFPKRGLRKFRGGYSDSDIDNSSSDYDVLGYLGTIGVDIFSDIISDSSL